MQHNDNQQKKAIIYIEEDYLSVAKKICVASIFSLFQMIRIRYRFFKILVQAFLIIGISSVNAEEPHFRITVPLKLDSLHPDVISVRSACDVFGRAGPSWQTGYSDWVTALHDRTVSGDVTVPILLRVNRDRDPRNVVSYQCRLQLTDGATVRDAEKVGDISSNAEFHQLKEYTGPVEGLFMP